MKGDAKIARLMTAIEHANEVCRTTYQIAARKGANTNWTGFRPRLRRVLREQHRIMYPGQYRKKL